MEKEIEDKIHEIASYLKLNRPDDIGLFTGIGGYVLFFYYYNKIFKKSLYDGLEYILLEDIFDRINLYKITDYSFCRGLSGIAWLLSFLHKNGDLSDGDYKITDELDFYLYNKMMFLLSFSNYDFLHGATGIVFYFLKKNKLCYLKDFVKQIDLLAIKEMSNYKWKNFILDNSFSVSLAHGMSSIILILTKIYELGVIECEAIINGGINFVISQKYPYKNRSIYPSKTLEFDSSLYSRMGWCYGDLGIALMILNVSKVLDNKTLYIHALEIIRESSKRVDLNKDFVFDACVCHGTSGIAMLFKSFYEYTKCDYLVQIWNFWVKKTMNFSTQYQQQQQQAGFKFHVGGQVFSSELEYCNLLQGVCGVGLSLLSTIDPTIRWEECLLMR
ncbi:hypothetical protein NBH15_07540 [Parabacteroides sp. W1-Q-101]|uniref:lanthionine synthetase LanC family protein n=1 Tax=Parabacteroides caeci TaxID=2949650 RepID=UPI002030AE0B|nr:lanthionine synthetase LanC family protein [Parabacteroides sp. W1-Q-101]MCM0718131.1 hypothetical protein [Parabacteroides sp. W1-Q-101]